MKTMGIIISSTYDDSLGELTNHRTVASLPFGGRYRQIDFILSNMSNSGIYNIGLVTKYNYRSLMDHLGSCEEWDLNRKNEGLRIIPPFASENRGVYRGKMEALSNAYVFLDNPDYDYVVISDSTVIFNLDLRQVVEHHAASGADVTMVASPGDGSGRKYHLALGTGEDGFASDIRMYSTVGKDEYAGMGVYVIGREFLTDNIRDAAEHGYVDFEKDFIQRQFNAGKLNVGVFPFNGVVLRNDNIESYFKNNMALLKEKTRKGLFKFYRPVYTRIRDEVPAYYGEGSFVADSIITDGCSLKGSVERSVLFRNVNVDKGARVRDCIIMHNAYIGENADLECVILDKDVIVREGSKLKGTPEHPVVVKKGTVI